MIPPYTEVATAMIEAEIAALWLIVVNEDANLTPTAILQMDRIQDYLDRLYEIGAKP